MTTTYKNIVYDGATLIAGGNIHIGDVVYQAGEDFHHSILFLRIEGSGQSFSAQLSVKSRHGGVGKLGKSGEPLLQQAIHLNIPERLFQQVEALQETRRSVGDLLRNVGANSAHAVQAQEAQVSQAIFTAFFSGDIGTVCHDFIQLLQKRKVSELLLAISTDDERVKNLPWEMVIPHLFPATEGAEKRSLAVRNFGLVRTMEASLAAFDLQGKSGNAAPLKLLFITALPENLSERDKLLEIEDEQRKLIEAVGKLEATGSQPKIVTEFLDNAALEEINAALSARRHDIVHVSGHGAYLAHIQQGVLFLENEWGDERQASGAELGETLRQHQCIKLLILSACETAICGAGGVIEQLATNSGIPVILAMRFAISDPAAKRFTTALYEMLAKGETLTLAISHAREALWQEVVQHRQSEPERPCPAEWFTPTVWLNQYTGPMVDLRQPYLLPDDFYPRSQFLRSRTTKLVGEGFIGRKRYLIRLRRLFSEGKTTCLHGLGGMGKTTLAEAFCRGYQNGNHEFIPFRNAHEINEKHILDELFARFCDQQSEPNLRRQLQPVLENPELDPTQKLQALLDNCLAGRKTILLFDNFEDVQKGEDGAMQQAIGSEGLRAFLLHLCRNAPAGCHLLFTTRYKITDLDGLASFVALDKLSYAEQYRLMNFSQHLRHIPMAQRDSVYRRLDGHPRAYEFLETLLAEDPSFDWAGLDASVGVVEAKVFEDLLLEKIWERLTESEQLVLKMASIFTARAPLAALAAVSGLPEAELLPVLQSLNRWSVCFLEEVGGFEVHRLTSKFILEQMAKSEGIDILKWHVLAGAYFEENHSFPDLENHLRARWHYLQGEDYEQFASLTVGISGVLELHSFDFRASRDLLFEVLHYEKNLSQEVLARVYHALAEVSLYFGAFKKAFEFAEKVLKIGEELSKGELKFLGMSTIGLICINQGLYKEALRAIESALNETQNSDFKGEKLIKKIAYTKHNIGICYQNLGKLDKSLKYYHQSFKDKEDIEDYEGMAISFHQIGNVYLLKKDYEEALTNYHQSLIIKNQLQNKRGAAATHLQLGVTYTKVGNFEDAEHYYVEALEFFQESGNMYNVVLTLLNIGHLKCELNQFEEAAIPTFQANYLEQAYNFPRLKKQIQKNLGAIAKILGKEKFDKLSYSIYEAMVKSNK